jgi:hypothetical protein
MAGSPNSVQGSAGVETTSTPAHLSKIPTADYLITESSQAPGIGASRLDAPQNSIGSAQNANRKRPFYRLRMRIMRRVNKLLQWEEVPSITGTLMPSLT